MRQNAACNQDMIVNLAIMRQISEVKSRLENIIQASDALIKSNHPDNDIYSLKEIGSYAIGFNMMIEEMSIISNEPKLSAVIERAELFCSIAERACQYVKH